MSRLESPVLHLTIRNDLPEIGRLAAAVEAFCATHGLGDGIAHSVNLALDELLTNTISYGYEDSGNHLIEMTLTVGDGRVTVLLRDDARAFDPTQVADPDLDAELDDRPIGGLGVHIVRAMMDGMTYRRVGEHNELTLTKLTGS